MTKQWLAHVKKTIHSHPGQSFSLYLKKRIKHIKKVVALTKKKIKKKEIRQKIKQEGKK